MQQVLDAIRSVFTKTAPQHVLEHVTLAEKQEAAVDRLCRTNPFLLGFSG